MIPKKISWKVSALLLITTLITHAACAENCPSKIRVDVPDYEVQPFILGATKIESPPGLLIEWMINAAAQTDCKPKVEFHRVPNKRTTAEITSGNADFASGIVPIGKNLETSVFPMRDGKADPDMALVRDSVSLYARADNQQVEWDGEHLRITIQKVGTTSGSVLVDTIAQQHHWTTDVADTPQMNLNKLLARRVDVILEPGILLQPLLTGELQTTIRKLEPPVLVLNRYSTASKLFYQSYPNFTQQYWLQLCMESRKSKIQNMPACQ